MPGSGSEYIIQTVVTLPLMLLMDVFFFFQFVFDAVTDVIIKNNLKDCGLF